MERDEDFYVFHFKTVWCPYNEDKHARDACVYAHNWQDFRRKPFFFAYTKEQCQNWESKNFIVAYSDGCKDEHRCRYSHGWKEQEYHPSNYKSNACRSGEACAKPHCPYFHSERDKRTNPPNGFRLAPKNRGVSYSSNYYLFRQSHSQALKTGYGGERAVTLPPSNAAFVNTQVFMQHPSFIESAAEGFEIEAQQLISSRQPAAAGGESSGTPPKPDHGTLRAAKKFSKSPSLNNTATPFIPKSHLAHTASHSEKLNAVHLVPVHPSVSQQPQIIYQTPVYY